jgi:hypothetical protein
VAAPTADPDTELLLGRYRLLEELGAGRFGRVVAAWDERMQRRVAIKRIGLPAGSQGTRPTGIGEARTAAMLAHPAIVTVYDFDVEDGEALLIMEHVAGASLADLLDEAGGALSPEEAAALIAPVGDALAYAHDNGVLHLDLKPENILVDREGRAKVTDFGMAELSSAAGYGGSLGGTLGYMPLEQLEGANVSERTDEWALASVAYEVLTGDNPFVAPSIEHAIERIETTAVQQPSDLADVDETVDDAILGALGVGPAERWPDVPGFTDVLLEHLGDQQIGREGLAELVASVTSEETGSTGDTPSPTSSWTATWVGPAARLVTAVAAGWLAWAGLSVLQLGTLATASAAGLVALAGAVAPAVGGLVAVLAIAVGLASVGASPVAALCATAALAYWVVVSRRSLEGAVAPLLSPLLGIVGLAPTGPLIAGMLLAPLQAAAAGFFGAWLTMLASALSGGVPPYVNVGIGVFGAGGLDAVPADVEALFAPGPILLSIGWGLAALVVGFGFGRTSRVAAAASAALGGAVLIGSFALAGAAMSPADPQAGAASWVTTQLLVQLTASFLVVVLLTVLLAPARTEGE